MTSRRAFNSRDRFAFASQQRGVVPESGPAHHHMAVVIRYSLCDPKAARAYWTREVPWTQLQWTKSFDIPNVEKLVGHGIKRVSKNSLFAQRSWFDNLRRGQMLHAIARGVIGGEVDQEGVRIKFRRTPHGSLGSHDLFDVANERRPLSTFIAK